MSSKRDDEPSDMEVGMTTAERRRRRRRGGGLRVPSDNVPRRASTAPPVVAPVPEDPALAMSIAYSFTNDGSEPVPRVEMPPPAPPTPTRPPPFAARNGDHATTVPVPVTADGGEGGTPDDAEELAADDVDEATEFAAPVAPEAASTIVDAQAEEPQEFEMKTREMSAVDLEALGLSELAAASSGQMSASRSGVTTPPPIPGEPASRKSSPRLSLKFEAPEAPAAAATSPDAGPSVVVDAALLDAAAEAQAQVDEERARQARIEAEAPRRERIRTVALSEEDLEEVREAVRSITQADAAAVIKLEAPAPVPAPAPMPAPTPMPAPSAAAEDRPVRDSAEIMSVPDIDIQVLSERNEPGEPGDSGDIVVDVDEPVKAEPVAAAPVPPTPLPRGERASTVPPLPPPTPERTRAASQPPPVSSGSTNPIAKLDAGVVAPHHAPPPPPPKATPPAPPAAPSSQAAKVRPASSPVSPIVKEQKHRAKPWFVEIFDEDYLRTLPFLTPQATQAEAEFVAEAMGLQPGAQVLDVGCGYGRHAMELAARGFHVVGLDLSTPLLVRGGEEATRRGLQINFVRGDMRELDFDAQFDGAYCVFSTFGYFDDETNKKTVANLARALKPGGRVLIEILNRDYLISDLPTRIWWEGEGCVVLEEVELNYFSSRIQVNRSVVFDDGRQLEQEISVRAYSLHEVGKLMHAAGFRVLEVSGGYHTRGRFFGNQSRHIIVLAERKDTPSQ